MSYEHKALAKSGHHNLFLKEKAGVSVRLPPNQYPLCLPALYAFCLLRALQRMKEVPMPISAHVEGSGTGETPFVINWS